MAAPAVEFELRSPPTDGISAVQFGSSTDNLLVSSWDKTCRVYDAVGNRLVHAHPQASSALCAVFSAEDDSRYVCGLVDGSVVEVDIERAAPTALASHAAGAKSVVAMKQTIISGGWDRQLFVHDRRSRQSAVDRADLPGKVYVIADAGHHLLLVATSDRHVLLYDARALSAGPTQVRQSSLKHQTRAAACAPTRDHYVGMSPIATWICIAS